MHIYIHTHTMKEEEKLGRNYNLVLIVFHKAVFVLMTPFLFLLLPKEILSVDLL